MKKALLLFASLAACSSNTMTTTDGGASDSSSGGDTNTGGSATQTGTITDFSGGGAFPMATVTTSTGATAMSGADGKYSLSVPKGMPFTFTVTGDGRTKLLEQESIVMGDVKRDETLVSTTLTGILKSSIPNYDPMKATLTVGFMKRPSCKSALGAIVSTNPPQPGSGVIYFGPQFPDANRTYALDEPMKMPPPTPRAIIYNLDPKATFQLVVTWAPPADSGMGPDPACKQVAYPTVDTDQSALTYTGKFILEAGDTISYARVFLE